MLLGISICCGKLSDYLIQFFRRKIGSSLCQGKFKLQVYLYISLPITIIGEDKPTGSKIGDMLEICSISKKPWETSNLKEDPSQNCGEMASSGGWIL